MKIELALIPLVFILGTSISPAKSAKILVLAIVSSASHKITYMSLVEELGRRGHSVTTLTGIKPFKFMANVTEIFTTDEWENQRNNLNIFEMKESNAMGNSFASFIDFFETICTTAYEQPHVLNIINEKFDLVILQSLFNECAAGLVYRLGVPFILFSPTSVPDFTIKHVGGYLPPSFVPNFFARFGDDMTFYERLSNFWITALNDIILKFIYEPRMTAIYRQKLGEDIPPAAEIFANASMILSNGHFIFSKPRPYFPDVVDVGGIHSKPAKPLPGDLENFISKSGSAGFIYFSLGSVIKGDKMPEPKRQIFLRVFSKLKQQVLWKWESESMPDLPKNVMLSKWLPQQDLLGHSNIKMFITHCGLGGTEEAIYHGVPMLGVPIFADQPSNARQSGRLGILLQLDWNTLTEEKLMEGIQEVLNSSKYKQSSQKLSKIFKDQPDHPLDRGIFWVEYVLRHKGAPHLRSVARHLNVLQYHSIDVIGATVTIIFSAVYILFALLAFGYRRIWPLLLPGRQSKDSRKKRQ